MPSPRTLEARLVPRKQVAGGLPGVGGGVVEGSNPRLHATDGAGRALWAAQHGGDPSGYDRASRAEQITWNSVAIHGY